MEPIYLYSSETPECPKCGCNNKWIVNQKLERSSAMIRVDGLVDLVVSPFITNDYNESISMTCNSCLNTYQPQPGIACVEDDRKDKTECYDETTEDYLAFPFRFVNKNEY